VPSSIATFNKFNLTVQDWLNGKTNYGADTFKAMLTDTLPLATNHVYGDISAGEMPNQGGYTTGGIVIPMSIANIGGLVTVTGNAVNPAWGGFGPGIGPFRYIVVYDFSAATQTLQYWLDLLQEFTITADDFLTLGPAAFTLQ